MPVRKSSVAPEDPPDDPAAAFVPVHAGHADTLVRPEYSVQRGVDQQVQRQTEGDPPVDQQQRPSSRPLYSGECVRLIGQRVPQLHREAEGQVGSTPMTHAAANTGRRRSPRPLASSTPPTP